MKFETLHVLIVEERLGVTPILGEAFAEIDEIWFAHPWMRPCQSRFVTAVDEALALLRESLFDVILLDVSVPGTRESSAFDLIHVRYPQVPVILLAPPGDESLALSLIRRGAQDFLLTTELDCVPLAKSIRAAVERTRHHAAVIQFRMEERIEGAFLT